MEQELETLRSRQNDPHKTLEANEGVGAPIRRLAPEILGEKYSPKDFSSASI